MSTFCLYVKASAVNRGTPVMTITRSGPEWTGRRLRLADVDRLGLVERDLIGWSDFYGGTPCDVHVTYASDGQRSGWLVWGGNLGLRTVPDGLEEFAVLRRRAWDALPLLWVDDPRHFAAEVSAALAAGYSSEEATRAVVLQG